MTTDQEVEALRARVAALTEALKKIERHACCDECMAVARAAILGEVP
jgi:hypothetical protein